MDDARSGSAAAIIARAVDTAAERVALRADAGFVFAEPTLGDVQRALAESDAARFKLQRRGDGGRWVDVSKYEPVAAAEGALIDAIRMQDLATAQDSTADTFDRACERDPRGMHFALRSLGSGVAVTPTLETLSPWQGLLSDRAAESAFVPARYLRSTLELARLLCEVGLEEALAQREAEPLLRALDGVANEYTVHGDALALRLMRAKALSLVDRDGAAAQFRAAAEVDVEDLVESFYVDVGAKTYFTAAEVDDAQTAPLVRGLRWLGADAPSSTFAAAVSVDPGFFRIYGSQLLAFAQQLPTLDLVVVLCCEQAEATALIEEAAELAAVMQRFNRSGSIDNIRYMLAPLPEAVAAGSEKTFYASARFFATRLLLEQYERLYLMDADLTAVEDPTSYFARISHVAFGVPENSNSSGISPWRRYGAGNAAVSRAALESPVLEDLERYLAHGLTQPSSWMLDQNALAFAIERNPHQYVDLEVFERPFTQLRFRSTWERNYRRANAERRHAQ